MSANLGGLTAPDNKQRSTSWLPHFVSWAPKQTRTNNQAEPLRLIRRWIEPTFRRLTSADQHDFKIINLVNTCRRSSFFGFIAEIATAGQPVRPAQNVGSRLTSGMAAQTITMGIINSPAYARPGGWTVISYS